MARKQALIYFFSAQCFPLCKTLITFMCSLPSKYLIWCYSPKKPKCKHFKRVARQQAQNSTWRSLHYLIHTGTEIRPHEEVHNKNAHNNRLLPKALDSFLCSFFPLITLKVYSAKWRGELGPVDSLQYGAALLKIKSRRPVFFVFFFFFFFFVFWKREGASRRGGWGLELFL